MHGSVQSMGNFVKGLQRVSTRCKIKLNPFMFNLLRLVVLRNTH